MHPTRTRVLFQISLSHPTVDFQPAQVRILLGHVTRKHTNKHTNKRAKQFAVTSRKWTVSAPSKKKLEYLRLYDRLYETI